MPLVHVDDERALIHEILDAVGTPARNAEVQARWLLEADLRGHHSHGVQRLTTITERILTGLTDPAAEPTLRWTSASALVVDGCRGLGPCVGSAALEALAPAAAAQGVAVAAVRNTNHLGLLAPYVEACAAEGLIGIALTTSEALVHPWGGRVAQLGTNPIAVGVPADPEPFVLDMATGVVSMGKVLDHRNRSLPLEPGWAVDPDGKPTLDAGAAASGAIAPFGGAKGYGLGLAFELLVASLTASALGRDVHGTLDATSVCNKGDVFVVLDPRCFDAPGFTTAVTDYLQALRATSPQEGFDRVLVPGDRARAVREERHADGFVIADSVWESLQELRLRVCSGLPA